MMGVKDGRSGKGEKKVAGGECQTEKEAIKRGNKEERRR